jgi:hypothetical protein
LGGRPQRSAGVGGTDEMAAMCRSEYGNRPPIIIWARFLVIRHPLFQLGFIFRHHGLLGSQDFSFDRQSYIAAAAST